MVRQSKLQKKKKKKWEVLNFDFVGDDDTTSRLDLQWLSSLCSSRGKIHNISATQKTTKDIVERQLTWPLYYSSMY